MKKKPSQIAFVGVLALLYISSVGQAQTVLTGTTKTTTSTSNAMQNGGAIGGSAYVPATVTQPGVSKTQGLENNGNNASGQQKGGQQAAMITMAAMAALAASTCPNPQMQAICAASLMGAMAAGMTGSQMGSANNKSQGQVTSVTPNKSTPGAATPTIENSSEYQAAVKDLSKATKSIGATLGKNGTSYTTADGKVVSPTNGGSSGGGGGMSAGEQKLLSDTMKKIDKEIKDKVGRDGLAGVEVNDGVGGSGGGPRAMTSTLSDVSSGVGSAGRTADLRKPASVAGDFKDFNGDKIGVAGDSMFEMMHRRYKVHGEGESLLKDQ